MGGVDDDSVCLDEQQPRYEFGDGRVLEILDPEKLFAGKSRQEDGGHLPRLGLLDPDKIEPFSVFNLFESLAKRGVFLDGEDAGVRYQNRFLVFYI